VILPAHLAPAEVPAATSPSTIDFLRTRLGLSDGDIARLARGGTVSRMVDERGNREIAVVGVAALGRAPQWSDDFDNVLRLRRSSPDLLGIGRLGAPPTGEDLAAVELDAGALQQLKKCRQTSCAANLPQETIDAIKREADRGGADFGARTNDVFRDMLRQVATRYQENGDGSLPVFTNRVRLVPTSDAPALLLSRRPSLLQLAPALDRHFRDCPRPGAPCTSDLFYWYREKSWKHEVVGLVQAAYDEIPVGGGRCRLLAEKVFYANHYFRSALSVTGVLEDAAGSYVFYLNRSETDNGSAFNMIERALAGLLIPRRMARQILAFREAVSRIAPGSKS
jgi:hypothetical protein